MAQFDLYKNRGDNSKLFPYLLDITHEINTVSNLRVVIPLCGDGHSIKHLNPIFNIKGQKLYLSTMDIAGIPMNILDKPIANLKDKRVEIIDALDFLVNGF